jgi:hypothetical protein
MWRTAALYKAETSCAESRRRPSYLPNVCAAPVHRPKAMKRTPTIDLAESTKGDRRGSVAPPKYLFREGSAEPESAE